MGGGLYSVVWILIPDPDFRYRHKSNQSCWEGCDHVPGLSVCLYGLSVCDLACL